jgi:hypothetical protein
VAANGKFQACDADIQFGVASFCVGGAPMLVIRPIHYFWIF